MPLRSEAGRGAWRLLRMTTVFVVASWAAVVGGFVATTPQGLGLAALVIGLVLLAAALVRRMLWRTAAPRAWRVLGRLLFALAAAVAVFEPGLRLTGALLPSSPLWLPASSSVDAQLEAYRFAAGSVRYGFPCNSLGYYDDEPPAADAPARWVACLGDSFVASAVPQPVHFTTVAERELGRSVQAFGVHAAGPREYLAMLQRDVLPLAPDALILSIFVGNDVSDSVRAESSWFRDVFHPKNARLLYLPQRLALGAAYRAEGTRALQGRVEGRTIILDTPHGELRGNAGKLLELLPTLTPWLFERSLEEPPYTEQAFLEIEHQRARQTCLPDAPGWAPFFRCLEELLAAAGTTPVAVLLLPDEFQVDDELWAQLVNLPGGQALDRDLPQRLITDFLRRRAVPCVDVLPDLRAATAHGEHAYLVRNTHFNLRGNDVTGHRLASFLSRVMPGK